MLKTTMNSELSTSACLKQYSDVFSLITKAVIDHLKAIRDIEKFILTVMKRKQFGISEYYFGSKILRSSPCIVY